MRSSLPSIAVASVLAAATGFCLHVFSAEWVQHRVATLMDGKEVMSSWDVRIPAAISSIEIGLGAALCYWLIRSRFPNLGWFRGGLCLTALVLMIKGNLIRQPLMNFLIGNPIEVVAVQDGITWLIWGLMGWTVAAVFAVLDQRLRTAPKLKDRTT